MAVEVKVGNKMIKDTFYTLTPVNWVLRFFVLSNVKRKHNKLVQCWSLTENLIVLSVMLTINILFLVNKVQRFEGYKNNEALKFTDSIQLTYLLGYMEYIVDLIFVYRDRHTCLKYLKFYTSIDNMLGVPDFSRIRKKNLFAIVSLIISFIVSSSLDYASWFIGLGWLLPTLYFIDYIYIFINALTVLDVVTNVTQIEYRLKVMLRFLEDCYASNQSLSGDEVLNDNWVFEQTPVYKARVERLNTVSHNKCFGILSLSKYYVLLMEQVTYINTAYGIRLGAFCLNLLINLIYLTNTIIRVTLGLFVGIPLYSPFHIQAVTTALRIMNYSSFLLILVYHCEQTYRLCAGIVRLIDLILLNKKIPSDLKTALMDLRTLVLSRPIKFHGANFFTLDYPLLVSVASVVFTYTIILLQSMK